MPVGAASARDYGSPRRDGRQGDEGTEAARLADAWAREAPAARAWREMPTEPAEHECGECGGGLRWHSAHTGLVCLACDTALAAPSPGAEERAGAHAEALARKRAGVSREVAVIDPGAEARARAARVDMHRTREMLRTYASGALTWCDAPYQQQYYRRLAHELGATIRGYLPEIDRAADNATLAEILRELQAIRQGAEFSELTAEHGRQQEQAERAAERDAYLARQAELEAERAAAERQALAEQQRAAEQQAKIAARQQRQLPAARQPSANTVALGYLAKMLLDHQQAAEQRKQAIAQNGTCSFCRRPTLATRAYGTAVIVGWGEQRFNDRAPHVRACPRHYGDADQWIKQNCPPGSGYYWELATA